MAKYITYLPKEFYQEIQTIRWVAIKYDYFHFPKAYYGSVINHFFRNPFYSLQCPRDQHEPQDNRQEDQPFHNHQRPHDWTLFLFNKDGVIFL